MDNISVTYTQDISRKMQEMSLEWPETKRSLQGGTRRSLAVLKSCVKSGAKTVTSNREKVNKGVKVHLYKRILGGYVGINKSFRLSNGHWFGLYLLEGGTANVIGRDGRKHGATPAKPFFKASAAKGVDKAAEMLSENIAKKIDQVVSKRV